MTNPDPSRHGNQTMSVPEAARYLGVGKKIVYQLIEFNELRAMRTGGAVRIDIGSLDAFRASGKLT
jgi:excisionase family DNA binding protein